MKNRLVTFRLMLKQVTKWSWPWVDTDTKTMACLWEPSAEFGQMIRPCSDQLPREELGDSAFNCVLSLANLRIR